MINCPMVMSWLKTLSYSFRVLDRRSWNCSDGPILGDHQFKRARLPCRLWPEAILCSSQFCKELGRPKW